MQAPCPAPQADQIGRTRLARLPCVLLLVVLSAARLLAQAPTLSPPPPATPTLSLSEMMERSEAARVRLQAIQKQVPPPDELLRMQTDLSRRAAQVEATADEISRRLDEHPPLSVLPDLSSVWLQMRPELTQSKEQVARLSKKLGTLAGEITQLAADAEQAHAALSAAHAPPEIIERDDLLRRAIAEEQNDLLAWQGKLLLLRGRATEILARADAAKADIENFRRAGIRDFFQPETVPLWRQGILWNGAALTAQVRQALTDFVQPLLPYLRRNWWKLGVQVLIFVLTALLLWRGRATVAAWPQRDVVLERFVGITQRPWSAALVASVVAVLPIEREAPRILFVIAGVLGISATLRLVTRVIDPRRGFLAYVLTIYAGAALLRGAFSASTPLLQAFVVVEALVACGLTWWVVQRRADRCGPRAERWVRLYGPFGIVLLAASFVAALCGYLDLGQFLVSATMGSAGFGGILIITTRVALGLSAYWLRVWPLGNLRLVRRNRDRILRSVTRTLTVLMTVLWVLLVLRNLRLLEGFLTALQTVLEVRLERGAISISLGDIVGFAITIWVSWLLSTFIRFVLEEEIYPRVTLPRGVPHLLSTLLHYVILVFGFFVALGVLGVDLTKATIVAGALGVGIGFGLQNVVNNFVSGLILLFERPVRVGDSVAIRDVAGEMQHIGIRSCVVHTWDGAEVILPNALLISDPVINWTLSDRLRRITLSVGVAYGTDPAVVIELLRGVVTGRDGVLASPEPLLWFTGFGDSALNFQVRVWTARYDSWGALQSELYLATYKVLSDAGIQIPFPQRDVHIEGTVPLPVRVVDDGGETGKRGLLDREE
jgi:potassium efflux system protein